MTVSYTHLDVYKRQLLSVFDASAPPVFAEALIKTYEVHEEDAVRRCFFSVTRDEQMHEQMCGLSITCLLYTSRCV